MSKQPSDRPPRVPRTVRSSRLVPPATPVKQTEVVIEVVGGEMVRVLSSDPHIKVRVLPNLSTADREGMHRVYP